MEQQIQTLTTTPIEDISRAETDMQIATAKKYPRDANAATTKAIAMATRNKRSAMKCIYCRPVGKNKLGKMQFATGISIRGMEAIYTQFGNLRIGSNTIGVREGKMIVRGVCFDLESNVMVTKEATKDVSGYSENQKGVTAQALASIAIRNSTEAVIPEFYRDDFLDAVKDSIAGETEKELEESLALVVKGFKEIGVKKAQVLELIEDPEDIDAEAICFIAGVFNFLKDNKYQIGEVFGKVEEVKPDKKEKKKASTSAKKKDEKPAEQESLAPPPEPQTPTQKYNTLNLQYLQKFGVGKADDLIAKYQESFKKLIKDFSDEQLNTVSGVMADELNA